MNFNSNQRLVLILSALCLLLMVIFPPTTFVAANFLDLPIDAFAGYQFIGKLHTWELAPILDTHHSTNASIFNIEPIRLSFQIIGLILVTILMVLGLDKNTSDKVGQSSSQTKQKTDSSIIWGYILVILGGIMLVYMVYMFAVNNLETSIGFIIGYFIIPVGVLALGISILIKKWV